MVIYDAPHYLSIDHAYFLVNFSKFVIQPVTLVTMEWAFRETTLPNYVTYLNRSYLTYPSNFAKENGGRGGGVGNKDCSRRRVLACMARASDSHNRHSLTKTMCTLSMSDNNRSCVYLVIHWGEWMNVPTRWNDGGADIGVHCPCLAHAWVFATTFQFDTCPNGRIL